MEVKLDISGRMLDSETMETLSDLLNHHAEHVNLVEEPHTQITK